MALVCLAVAGCGDASTSAPVRLGTGGSGGTVSVDVCEYRPPVGDFAPTIGCRWTPPEAPPGASAEAIELASMSDVVMTPSVANLTDDNGDGLTDVFDIPDIAFVSFNRSADGCCTSRGVLRVVSGACNGDGTMNTHASLKGLGAEDWIGNSTGIALGNLHPDDLSAERIPEIVATFKNGGTIAWRRTADDGSVWEVMWQNDALPNNQHTRGGAQPSIADLNADGRPEVIVGNVVLDGLTGKGPNDADLPVEALAWDGRDLESATPGSNLGIGNNAFLGPVSTVADLDRDGLQEVIAGNTVYNHDGSLRWTYEYTTINSSCGGSLDCDGYNAVGNFDGDDDGEVVIVRQGELFILDDDGSPVSGIPLPIRIPGAAADVAEPTYSAAAYVPSTPLYDEDGDLLPPERILCGGALNLPAFDSAGNPIMSGGSQVVVQTAGANESGPPTVADFDGDGFAEVGTASSTAYVVFDFQCTGDPLPPECEREWVRWLVENDDCLVSSISKAMAPPRWCMPTKRRFESSGDPTAPSCMRTRPIAATPVWRCPSWSTSTTTGSPRSSSPSRIPIPVSVASRSGKTPTTTGSEPGAFGTSTATASPTSPRMVRFRACRRRTGRARGSIISGRTFSPGGFSMRPTSSYGGSRGSIVTRAISSWRLS